MPIKNLSKTINKIIVNQSNGIQSLQNTASKPAKTLGNESMIPSKPTAISSLKSVKNG